LLLARLFLPLALLLLGLLTLLALLLFGLLTLLLLSLCPVLLILLSALLLFGLLALLLGLLTLLLRLYLALSILSLALLLLSLRATPLILRLSLLSFCLLAAVLDVGFLAALLLLSVVAALPIDLFTLLRFLCLLAHLRLRLRLCGLRGGTFLRAALAHLVTTLLAGLLGHRPPLFARRALLALRLRLSLRGGGGFARSFLGGFFGSDRSILLCRLRRCFAAPLVTLWITFWRRGGALVADLVVATMRVAIIVRALLRLCSRLGGPVLGARGILRRGLDRGVAAVDRRIASLAGTIRLARRDGRMRCTAFLAARLVAHQGARLIGFDGNGGRLDRAHVIRRFRAIELATRHFDLRFVDFATTREIFRRHSGHRVTMG